MPLPLRTVLTMTVSYTENISFFILDDSLMALLIHLFFWYLALHLLFTTR